MDIYRRCVRVLVVMLAAVLVSACTPRLGDTEADLALEDLVAGHSPSRLKAQTSAPLRQVLAYGVDGRRRTADLYHSPAGVRAGIVLVPGVVEAGKDDPRLVALAHTLARLGFAVLVPDVQGLRRQQVRRSDVQEVADALRHLVSQPQWAPQGRAGIAGFSYGVGPVLLAVLETDLRERVQFVLALGGYYDLHSVVTFFTTGYYRNETSGQWRYVAPNRYASWVFALSNADLLSQPEDRARFRQYVEHLTWADPADPMPDMSGLAPDAQALQDLLLNNDPDHVPVLVDRLSPRIRDELDGINPANHDLTSIKARVILLHGRRDNMIPYTESVALMRALPPRQVSLFLIEGFAHVDVRVTRRDIPVLLEVMELLLEQRGGGSD